MPVWQETAKITNVEIKNVANESITDVVQAFNTMLSSGDLPDLIPRTAETISPITSQGALIPAEGLILERASAGLERDLFCRAADLALGRVARPYPAVCDGAGGAGNPRRRAERRPPTCRRAFGIYQEHESFLLAVAAGQKPEGEVASAL